jgi:SsrA-binding protein|tara:strand:+ start:610 stop:1059 length:450 start_codon:yes stop_codon:yes gene_type:complete
MSLNKIISVNRKAFYDYEILERFEAGLVLLSSEIKSIRGNRVNLSGAFAHPRIDGLWLHNCHIAPYADASRNNHEPMRPRKLLLHKKELKDLSKAALQKGHSVVPLKMYIVGHYAKIELGIGRGKKRYDKRKSIKDKERLRDSRAAQKR